MDNPALSIPDATRIKNLPWHFLPGAYYPPTGNLGDCREQRHAVLYREELTEADIELIARLTEFRTGNSAIDILTLPDGQQRTVFMAINEWDYGDGYLYDTKSRLFSEGLHACGKERMAALIQEAATTLPWKKNNNSAYALHMGELTTQAQADIVSQLRGLGLAEQRDSDFFNEPRICTRVDRFTSIAYDLQQALVAEIDKRDITENIVPSRWTKGEETRKEQGNPKHLL